MTRDAAPTRSARSSSWLHRLLPATTVIAVLLAAYSVLTSDLRSAVTFAAVALVLLWALLRSRRAAVDGLVSARARREWDAERVRTVAREAGVDPATRRVAAVKAVRQADRRLSLRDAVELVEAAATER